MSYSKLIAVVFLLFLFSCSKKENTSPIIDEKPTPADKITLIIEVKNGSLVSISTISNSEKNSKSEAFTNLTSFEKEYNSLSVVNVVAKGVDVSSILTVKVMKGKDIIKSGTSAGAEMSTNLIIL